MTPPRHARPAEPIRLGVWRQVALLGFLGAGAPAAILVAGAAEARGVPVSSVNAPDSTSGEVSAREGHSPRPH